MKVFTFEVRGGQEVTLQLKEVIGPALAHDGTHTLWKMVGTPEMAAEVEQLLTGPLVGASVKVFSEEQTEEQAKIRRQRLGR
jgi:hypothetical protein